MGKEYSAIAVIVLIFCAIFIQPGTANGQVLFTPNSATRITAEGGSYDMTAAGSRIAVQNTDSGRNNREIYWDKDSPDYEVATQCATWRSGSDITQNGIVFRFAQVSGGYNAIVLERNIWSNLYWMFNVLIVHTGDGYENIYEGLADTGPTGIDLGAYLGHGKNAVWPLRICASLDTNDKLSFAVAKGIDQVPSLANPGKQGGYWNLVLDRYYHPGDGRTGKNGIWVGHVPQGTTVRVDDVLLSNLAEK